MLDAQDDQFDQFAVWQDANSDGITDEGELQTLSELGIDSIDLNYSDDSEPSTAADGDVTIHGQVEVKFLYQAYQLLHSTTWYVWESILILNLLL